MRASGRWFVLTVVLASLPAASQAQAPDPLEGLWGFEQLVGPATRGALVLSRNGGTWTLRLAGFEVHQPQAGDTVRLALPGDRGVLRVHLTGSPGATAPTPRAMWIQPAGMGAPYASPVRLRSAGIARWRGVVNPIDERFSLYLAVHRDSSGGWQGQFRNPEANFGGGRVWRVVREPNQIGLVDMASGRRRFTQSFDSAARTIGFDFGTPVVAVPRTLDDAIGFVPRPLSEGPYAYRTPAELGDGWTIAAPASVGMLADSLAALVRHVANADPLDDSVPRVHSIVVARRGRLVLDEYFYGYAADRPHDLRSASKTMTSILFGVAMHRGAAIAPETKVTPAGGTVGQLLTHTSGLACDDDDSESPGNEDVMQSQQKDRNWYRYALALPQRHPPGTAYAYCSAGINLVGQVIARADGRWLPEFFDEELARPLGIDHYGINLMPTGEGYAAGGMHMRPRDFLKFGQLYLDGGVWLGRRLVDRAWVERSTRRQQPVASGADDGYAWHRHTLRVSGRDVASYEASGNGGQFLVVVPSLDLVVVVTAGNYGQGRTWWSIRQELIARYVVGAVVR